MHPSGALVNKKAALWNLILSSRVLGRSIRTTAVKRVCRGYFPLIHTHRFFSSFGVTEVPSHTGRRGGGLNQKATLWNLILSYLAWISALGQAAGIGPEAFGLSRMTIAAAMSERCSPVSGHRDTGERGMRRLYAYPSAWVPLGFPARPSPSLSLSCAYSFSLFKRNCDCSFF